MIQGIHGTLRVAGQVREFEKDYMGIYGTWEDVRCTVADCGRGDTEYSVHTRNEMGESVYSVRALTLACLLACLLAHLLIYLFIYLFYLFNSTAI